MDTEQSPNPVAQDATQIRSRSSSQMSFASSFFRSSPIVASAGTVCADDDDAFSYDAAHLNAWYLPETLWDCMPPQVKATLTSVQHAGAAVLTGFDRLDEQCSSDPSISHQEHADENSGRVDAPLRTLVGNENSSFSSAISSPQLSASPSSQSVEESPVELQSQTMSPRSHIFLGKPELDKLARPRERSFSVPRKPNDSYFAAELSFLKTEAIPRLRHACQKMDTNWSEAKRTDAVSAENVAAFEQWWTDIKYKCICLHERGKRLAEVHGVPNTGRGWCAL